MCVWYFAVFNLPLLLKYTKETKGLSKIYKRPIDFEGIDGSFWWTVGHLAVGQSDALSFKQNVFEKYFRDL